MRVFNNKLQNYISSLGIFTLLVATLLTPRWSYAQCNSYNVGGGGSICVGSESVNITLSGSQSGYAYQLRWNSTTWQTLTGTGSPLTFTGVNNPGTYTIVAVKSWPPSCTLTMSGSATVTAKQAPTDITLQGASSVCASSTSTAWMASSDVGVTYQLRLNGSNLGAPLPGTNAALSWTISTGGVYTVLATFVASGCQRLMPGSINLTVNPRPLQFHVGGGGNFCSGGSGVTVLLDGSEAGVNYQLQVNGVNSGAAIPGTGGSLAWAGQSSSGNYSVVATHSVSGCAQTMSGSANVQVSALPGAYSVSGGSPNGVVTLSGSQTGISYRLRLNGAETGIAISGTGGQLSWADQNAMGTYEVLAVNPATSCQQLMAGSAIVSCNSFNLGGGGSICVGSESVNVTLSGSQAGLSYELRWNSTTWQTLTGTGSPLTFTGVNNPGTYTIVAVKSWPPSCTLAMTGSVSVSAKLAPAISDFQGDNTICSGATATVSLSSSEINVNYQLVRNSVNSGPFLPGDGSALTWNGLTNGGLYTVVATHTISGCNVSMSGAVNLQVNPLPVQYLIGSDGFYCSETSGARISLSGSDAGISYELFKNGIGTGLIQNGTGGILNWNNQWEGDYALRAVNPSTGCGQVMNGTATVTMRITPMTPAVVGTFRYGAGSFNLLATTEPSDGFIWYSPTGQVLSSSNLYVTPIVASTTDNYCYVRQIRNGCASPSTWVNVTVYPLPSMTWINRIITNTLIHDVVIDENLIRNLPVEKNTQTIQYFDGLGRPVQTVGTQASPTKKDVVQSMVYDALGRESKKYLPVVTNTVDGWYKPNLIDAAGNYNGLAASFYSNPSDKIADDSRPFSETVFEPSPLNRPSKDYGAGLSWAPLAVGGNDKFVGHGYLVNVHGTATGEERVIAWQVDGNGNLSRAAVLAGYVETGGFYATGQLSVKSTKDEQDRVVREYVDKDGRTVLKKVQAVEGTAQTNNDSHWAMTYYVYDDLGNLSLVLPPEAVRSLAQN